MSKGRILKYTEQIGYHRLATEWFRYRVLMREQIRCFLDFLRLREQFGYQCKYELFYSNKSAFWITDYLMLRNEKRQFFIALKI